MFPSYVSKEAYEKKIAKLEREIENGEHLFCFIIAVIVVVVSAAAIIWGRV